MSYLVLHPCSVLTPDDPNSSYAAAISKTRITPPLPSLTRQAIH